MGFSSSTSPVVTCKLAILTSIQTLPTIMEPEENTYRIRLNLTPRTQISHRARKQTQAHDPWGRVWGRVKSNSAGSWLEQPVT